MTIRIMPCQSTVGGWECIHSLCKTSRHQKTSRYFVLGEFNVLEGCAVMYRSKDGSFATCKAVDCVQQCACWSTPLGSHSICPGACCPAVLLHSFDLLSPSCHVLPVLFGPPTTCCSTPILPKLAAAPDGPQALRHQAEASAHAKALTRPNTPGARALRLNWCYRTPTAPDICVQSKESSICCLIHAVANLSMLSNADISHEFGQKPLLVRISSAPLLLA